VICEAAVGQIEELRGCGGGGGHRGLLGLWANSVSYGRLTPLAMSSPANNELTPRAREIVETARELLEAEGAEGRSMRALAERLGIRAPSLYKHFPSKEALAAAVISQAFEEQAELFEAALQGSDEPIAAMGEAYRTYARNHPHLYRLMTERQLN